MSSRVSPSVSRDRWYFNLLRCPDCQSTLSQLDGLICSACAFVAASLRDLRHQVPREVHLAFKNLPAAEPNEMLRTIDTSSPQLTYRGPKALRDSTELMSEVSLRLPSGGDVLDLGCGPRDQAAPLESLGFKYLGVDYSGDAADFLADAHSLPLADESFECVFSYAVLEHLHNPHIALEEIFRVLKPGGWYIGTVSQGEPFHSSYFHPTPWGLIALVGSRPGLRIERLWPSDDTLGSLASMGRYSRVIRGFLSLLNKMNLGMPWLTPRKMRWPLKDRELDRLYRAGSICFAIQKRTESVQGR